MHVHTVSFSFPPLRSTSSFSFKFPKSLFSFPMTTSKKLVSLHSNMNCCFCRENVLWKLEDFCCFYVMVQWTEVQLSPNLRADLCCVPVCWEVEITLQLYRVNRTCLSDFSESVRFLLLLHFLKHGKMDHSSHTSNGWKSLGIVFTSIHVFKEHMCLCLYQDENIDLHYCNPWNWKGKMARKHK